MTEPTATYPKRPAFFAAKFCRLLLKACVANELGADAAMLLMAVASTEDAKGYRGPVNFWNAQLLPLIGCRSDSAFRRLRDRCERAGWLRHNLGTKWCPPSYWVTIPPQFDGWDDAATDESASKYETHESKSEQASGGQAAGKRNSRGEQAANKRRTSGEQADGFLPVPEPKPEPRPNPPSPPQTGGTTAAEPALVLVVASPAKPPRPRNELFDAVAEVTGADPVVSGSHVGKLAAVLSKAEPPYTASDVREFGRRFLEFCPWASGERDRPTIGEIQKNIGRIRAGPSAATPASPHRRGGGFQTHDARVMGDILDALGGTP
jgi:hypothetical protein